MKAALRYAEIGWPVVPLHDVTAGACSCRDGAACRSPGKHPRLQAWQREATSDVDTINAWCEAYPAGNVGIATGGAFFALDVDPDKGGNETLADLIAEHGALPHTVQARTGSGGSHYLFKMIPGLGGNTAGKLGAGLDTRSAGGQIVVCPSVSLKGKYQWVHGPFKTQIADAPEWLIAMLTAAPPALAPGASTTDRGFFPAASAAVLQAASAALVRHGPAIDKQGGGLHTVVAGAILTHDFALTDDEAWSLFVEWNEGCQPPWEHDGRNGLRVMLGRGRKYGKGQYGARRSMDAVETAQKLITDWKSKGTQTGMQGVIEEARNLAAISGDVSKRAVIVHDLKDATGLSERELGVPSPTVFAEAPAGSITVDTEIHKTADDSIAKIQAVVFQRNGVLCEVVKSKTTFISDLETARIQDLMSRSAKYVRKDEKQGFVAQVAPLAVATVLHSRRTHPVRVLDAVTTAPVFLADGSILQARGYNAAARVFLEPSVSVDVPDDATIDDARAAIATLTDILQGFDFAEEADRSSWLAALLSPLVKSATNNAPAPLFCVSASSAGGGKTLLANVIAQIITGAGIENSPYNPKDPAEWGKRLTAFVKAASAVRAFDNCNGPFGDENLDRLITASTWSDRVLGASEAPPLPIVTTWLATGNNIEPQGDTVRRVLIVRLDVKEERPQERTGFKYNLEGDYAIQHRSELLSAALTILRAYHCAGRPTQALPAWGSFSTWSTLVRGALVWAGCADPFLTQRRAADDLNEPDNNAHDFWISVVEESDGMPASIAGIANRRQAQEVLSLRELISPYNLMKLVRRFIDKPRAGQRIRKDRDQRRGSTRLIVERIT